MVPFFDLLKRHYIIDDRLYLGKICIIIKTMKFMDKTLI